MVTIVSLCLSHGNCGQKPRAAVAKRDEVVFHPMRPVQLAQLSLIGNPRLNPGRSFHHGSYLLYAPLGNPQKDTGGLMSKSH